MKKGKKKNAKCKMQNQSATWQDLIYYSWTMCATHDNIFRMVSLNLFFAVWTNLINSNIFYNHIFIYYRDNNKCNIYNFYRTKMKTI